MTYRTEREVISSNERSYEERSSRQKEMKEEITKKWGGSASFDVGAAAKALFGSGNGDFFSFKLSGRRETSVVNTNTEKWSQARVESMARKAQEKLLEVQNEVSELESFSGVIRTEFRIVNRATPARDLRLEDMNILLVSYDWLGVRHAWSHPLSNVPSSITIPSGGSHRFQPAFLGINTVQLLRAIGDGHVFTVEFGSDPRLYDVGTGADLLPTLRHINERTSWLNVHYGARNREAFGAPPLLSRRVAIGSETGDCLTPRRMLERIYGRNRVAYKVVNGTEVIKRVMDYENRFDEVPFDSLTSAEKDQFGRWVVGYRSGPFAPPGATFSLDMPLTPFDEINLYFLRHEDFEEGETLPKFYDLDDQVGVVVGDLNDCAAKDQVEIYMDTEDRKNNNQSGGWIGATVVNKNVRFRFCRSRNQFGPISDSSPTVTSSYAVLKLGRFCPSDTIEFTRYFDNEDKNNKNWASGLHDPNVSSKRPSFTKLYFCLFVSKPGNYVYDFPDLGYEYGVFAGPDFDESFVVGGSRGAIYTDDEDRKNNNWLKITTSEPNIESIVHHIINPVPLRPGTGTKLYLARVK